jgi:hypothetical protein
MLTDRKPKCFHQILTEESWIKLELSLNKHLGSLKCLAQEMGVPNGTGRITAKLLKLRPYKTAAVHSLQPHDSVVRLHFCGTSSSLGIFKN